MSLSTHLHSRDRAPGIGWLRTVWAVVGASLALTAGAAAQTAPPRSAPDVIVDWSAFNALGPAPARPALAPVTLHAPPERHVAAPPPRRRLPQRTAAVPTLPAPSPPPSASLARLPAPPPPQPQIAVASPPAPPPRAPAATPASLPPHAPTRTGMVQFAPGSSDISREGQALLDAVAGQLAANTRLRLQLVAYAGASGDDAIEARRIALARALQMRSFLSGKGIATVRMDVRALGNRSTGDGPPDRVDLVILDR